MAWLAVDKDGIECVCEEYPIRDRLMTDDEIWWYADNRVELPKGTIKKLIGRELTWDDEPVEL